MHKLLIIGHGRHGKDTVAEILHQKYGYSFTSSSEFVGRRAVWPQIQSDDEYIFDNPYERYGNFNQCFADRVNYRKYWGDAISAYNTPDKTRTASELFAAGFDMYVGIRRRDELEAVVAAELFDHIIWVDRSELLPDEDSSSMELNRDDATIFLDNNGSLHDLNIIIQCMMTRRFGLTGAQV